MDGGSVGGSRTGSIVGDDAGDSADRLALLWGPEVARVSLSRFSGPLPDPETLRAYEEIHPDLLPTVLEMARASTIGRAANLERMSKAESFGVVASAATTPVIAVGGLTFAGVLIANGHDVSALLTAVPAVLISVGKIVSAFRGRRSDDADPDAL